MLRVFRVPFVDIQSLFTFASELIDVWVLRYSICSSGTMVRYSLSLCCMMSRLGRDWVLPVTSLGTMNGRWTPIGFIDYQFQVAYLQGIFLYILQRNPMGYRDMLCDCRQR